jgi:hypothetical protein
MRYRRDCVVLCMKSLTLLISLSLSACATCETHKIACGVGAGILVTSIALSVNHHDSELNSVQVNPVARPVRP